MSDCEAGCGVPLDQVLQDAGIGIHPACAGPMPRPETPTSPAAPVPSGSCDMLGCNDGPVTYYERQGSYDLRHARMMIPRAQWSEHGVPEPEPG